MPPAPTPSVAPAPAPGPKPSAPSSGGEADAGGGVEPPSSGTTEGGSDNTGGSVSNASEGTSSEGGSSGGGGKSGGGSSKSTAKSKEAKTNVGSLIGSGDIVITNNRNDNTNNTRMTASMTKSNYKNTFAQGFLFNFTTKINNSNLTLYTASTSILPVSWVTAPTDRYPYQNIQDSYNALTAITIIPSGGSTYVSTDMPATTVQYDGNGNTSGSPPNPQYFAPYTGVTPTSITLRTNSGSLTKSTPPSTFSGWNTAADGTGTSYAVSATYSGTASLILYARWI
jgi:uncharacterized repeat protein (TIGR02543 family)